MASSSSCNFQISDLGLALGLSMTSRPSSYTSMASSPVQLELLPLQPSSQKAQAMGFCRAVEGHILQCVIDVNRMPSISESESGEGGPILQLFPSGVHGIKCTQASDSEHEKGVNEVPLRGILSDDEEGGPGVRKKLRLSKEQSGLLEESFKEQSTLTPKQKMALAKQLSLRPRQVEVWFQNRRARTKLKQTEVACELLKRCCESLSEENKRLQKEVAELRALKVGAPCLISHDFHGGMPVPAATLTMCPSCECLVGPHKATPFSSITNSIGSFSPKPTSLSLAFTRQHQQPSAAC